MLLGPHSHLIATRFSAAEHIDRVEAFARGYPTAPVDRELASSWRRCVHQYAIDPTSSEPPRVLTASELKDHREPLGALIECASGELDRLYNLVKRAGYAVLLCDKGGVVVDHRANQEELERFKYWGTCLGSVWSEYLEGTNSMGTCIVEQRPVTVHQRQHFRARHIGLSGSAAPIFGVDPDPVAVLDISCIDPELSARSHALTGSLTVATARVIEERLFRDRFRQHWIVAVENPDASEPAMLLAVDNEQQIVGADRNARATLFRNRVLRKDISLWTIYDRDPAPFRPRDGSEYPAQLVLSSTAEVWPALITLPDNAVATWRNAMSAGAQRRPRLDLLGGLRPEPLSPARGGLPPQKLRRVREFIETHLDKNIDLGALAGTADLSLYHFARAFKQSTGVTPHAYLLQRRVKRAHQLLVRTNLPLAEIALQTGFADHSHFARQFRRLAGTSPSKVRRARS